LARFTATAKGALELFHFHTEIHSKEGLTSSVRGAKAGSGEAGHGDSTANVLADIAAEQMRPIFSRSSSGAGRAARS